MVRYTANEILVMLDQEECMNEVMRNLSMRKTGKTIFDVFLHFIENKYMIYTIDKKNSLWQNILYTYENLRPFLLEPVVKKGIVVIHLDDGSNERDDYDGGNGNKEDENEKRVNGLNKNEEEQDNQERDNEVEVCTDDEERNADEDNNEDSNEERDGDDRRNREDGAYMFFKYKFSTT